jgi:hypothetical protein
MVKQRPCRVYDAVCGVGGENVGSLLTLGPLIVVMAPAEFDRRHQCARSCPHGPAPATLG